MRMQMIPVKAKKSTSGSVWDWLKRAILFLLLRQRISRSQAVRYGLKVVPG